MVRDRIERVQRSLETNFLGPLKVTKAVLPIMREQKSGIVAFIGSIVSGHLSNIVFAHLLTPDRVDGMVILDQLHTQLANSL